MNQHEIEVIETSLGINLPASFRRASASGLLSRILNSDSQSVAAINLAFRSGEFGDSDWPHQMFAFGDDGAGNFYCLDLSSDSNRVLIRDHETRQLIPEAESFSDWIRGEH